MGGLYCHRRTCRADCSAHCIDELDATPTLNLVRSIDDQGDEGRLCDDAKELPAVEFVDYTFVFQLIRNCKKARARGASGRAVAIETVFLSDETIFGLIQRGFNTSLLGSVQAVKLIRHHAASVERIGPCG